MPKACVEVFLQLDVNKLHRLERLLPGRVGIDTWTSTLTAQVIAEVGTIARKDEIEFVYNVAGEGASTKEIRSRVALAWTPCNYGGRRPWFLCPECGRRVGKLYGGPFKCRHCHNLTYVSRQEDGMSRLLDKAQKIRLRLGGTANTLEPFPPKPKGMHWRTYQRLREQELEARLASLSAALDSLR